MLTFNFVGALVPQELPSLLCGGPSCPISISFVGASHLPKGFSGVFWGKVLVSPVFFAMFSVKFNWYKVSIRSEYFLVLPSLSSLF